MNITQLKLNAIIRDIQNIAVEINILKKRVSDLELAQISVNMNCKVEQPVIPNQDLEANR